MTLHFVDYVILALYFAFVLGIGWFLKKRVSTSEDFLTSKHSMPLWITSLAFLAANMGALEMIGMAGSGAKYGMMTSHFYWIGAIPAMIFVGVFMMPFYYGSRARSVPEYLKLRFDEKTRGFNAITFAVMTIFTSGISMYALGILFQALFGWSFEASVLTSAAIVLAYTYLGGLASAIYNEVLQFFLIVIGFAPLAILAVSKADGWSGMRERLDPVFTEAWRHMGSASANPMGVEVFGLVMGLAFVLSFGYWCTNYLVVQRAMAARTMTDARNTPLVGAFPKMLIPFIVIVPGIAALALMKMGSGYQIPPKGGSYDYDMVLITLMQQFYPSGMLGVGITALMASFMSGMAGNVTAFNTVWTYDIYQSYIRKDAPDSHYLWMGRMATIFGTALSIGAAYLARSFNNMMDFLQLIFGFVNAPLFATFLLGMFWKRTTANGAFVGLLSGTFAAAVTHGVTVAEGKGGWLSPMHQFPSGMAQNFWVAIWAWTACFVVTILVSLTGKPRPAEELRGLVYGLTALPADEHEPWYRRPSQLAILVGIGAVILNILFW
ncbi:MAG: sodium:solute symporter family protein [Bryobacteraceae bacterium]|nr:sodium:solute symporter family protein [Bryobacteraceae bacterium]